MPMVITGAPPSLRISPEEARPAIHRGLWLRPVAVFVSLVFVVTMSAAWIRVARGASHSLQAYRAPTAPTVLTMAYPNQGLDTGDRILAVDGIPASDPAADEAFWRQRAAGDQLTLRVQRAANGKIEDVVVPIRPPLTDPAILVIFVASTISVTISLAVAAFVAIARPDEPAVRPYLLAGVAAGLGVPPAIWTNLPTETWDLGIRAAYFLPAFSSLASLHLFLIFPTKHPFMLWLQRLGPARGGRISVGVALLYAIPTTTMLALTAGPLPTIGATAFVGFLCIAATLAAMIRSYLHPASIFTRAQLVWIFWAYVVTCVSVAALVAVILLVGEPASYIRAGGYVVSSLVPLATGFAVLRYRLFDVGRVVRDSVTYGLLTVCLVVGYFLITFVASGAIEAVVGRATAAQSASIATLAAAAMAILAIPLHRRLQAGLDRLVYRARSARRQFVREADAVLSRAQPLDALTGFLTEETIQRLDLTGAWLVLPAALRGGSGDLPAPPEPLLERLATTREPSLLTREDLSASAFPVLSGSDPALAAWWEAGARLLAPLRATVADGDRPNGKAQDRLIGVWALGMPRSGDLPEREDLDAIGRVGRQAAVLLDYARLNHEQINQALIKQDLARALEVQQRLLPLAHPGWPGRLEIAARLQAARETSGDFYDILDLPSAGAGPADAACPPLQIALGDVRGKGMGAAVIMAMAMSALRTGVEQSPGRDGAVASPAATLDLVGRQLHRSLGTRDFVCCALAVLEPTAGDGLPRLRLANAGQIPPLLCQQGGVRELVPDGDTLPLGVLPDPDYCEVAVELQPGDVVVFASDGLVEAPAVMHGRSAAAAPVVVAGPAVESVVTFPQSLTEGGIFGFGRLAQVASEWAVRGESAGAVADGIWAALDAWCGGDFRHDDVTLVVLRVKASSEDPFALRHRTIDGHSPATEGLGLGT